MAFECAECGYGSMKWLGRCPACSQWDTFAEINEAADEAAAGLDLLNTGAAELSRVEVPELKRISTGMPGMDRLLGGGAVPGEVILLGGPPGVGKSTLFLQMAGAIASAGTRVLYVSGEESPAQVKIHADRLGVSGENITVLGSGNIENMKSLAEDSHPGVIFIDSIQAVADPGGGGAPGTVKQVRNCGQKITALAKNSAAVIFVSGQITKQGDIAGPKLLEHMVDAVLYMESGEGDERILSAEKNRFGSCGDFLLLSLGESGLSETENPESPACFDTPASAGRAFCCVRTGRRLMAAEIQTLAAPSYFEYPLRRTSGFSRERLLMLSAIGARYLGLKAAKSDVYMNVSGLTRLTQRSSDLAAVASLYSGCTGIPIPGNMIFSGEAGLSGEIRPLRDAAERYAFAARNGFKKIVISSRCGKIETSGTAACIYIKDIGQLREILGDGSGLRKEKQ